MQYEVSIECYKIQEASFNVSFHVELHNVSSSKLCSDKLVQDTNRKAIKSITIKTG